MPIPGRPTRLLRFEADGLLDADQALPGPVWLTLEVEGDSASASGPLRGRSPRVRHLGPAGDPDAPPPDATVRRPGCVLIPGLVNAHTHLDLTGLGPRPHDPARGFVPWADMIRRERPADPGEVRAAITRGAELCLAGGVVAVGDILGAPRGRPMIDGFPALAESPLHGVGFVEFFGIGARAPASLAALPELIDPLGGLASERVRPGLQPHAPNTVSLPVYLAAAAHALSRGLSIATHLAETLEERRFVSDAAGPQRELLESLGIWDDAELALVGRGRHPVEHLRAFLERAPVLAAHLNDCPDHALAILRQTPTSVAYCPRASAYFGAPERLGPHRYREMLAAGVNVCLGTDSLVNLDTPDRISVLDEARLLSRRDATPPGLLMAMATRHGARALGLDERAFALGPGSAPAGVVAVPASGTRGDVGGAVLGGTGDPEVLFLRTDSCFVGHNRGKSNA